MITGQIGNYNVRVVAWLPYEVTYKACDIKTQQEVIIPTGEIVNAVTMGDDNQIFCDQATFDTLKQLPEINKLKITKLVGS